MNFRSVAHGASRNPTLILEDLHTRVLGLPEARMGATFDSVLQTQANWKLDVVAARAAEGKKCVVCAWGDLNFSARELVERVQRRVDETVLIPGISSVQVACSRLGLYMEESIFITLHARAGNDESMDELMDMLKAGKRNVLLLPRPYELMPAGIAKMLLERGISPQLSMHVLQRLCHADESMQQYTLASLAEEEAEFSDLTIMVFPRT